MVKLKKIGVLSLGKIFGIIYGLMGLILGMIITLLTLAAGSIFSDEPGMPELFEVLLGTGATIALPLFYGFIGFIMGLITALFYNFAASRIGGLEIEME